MLHNAYEMRKFENNGAEKMRALIGMSPTLERKNVSPIRKHNNHSPSGMDFIQEFERDDKEDIDPDGDFGAFSRGKKSQTWARVEVLQRRTEPLGSHKPDQYGTTEGKPSDPITRPQTSAGYKKKLTIHDMIV